MNLTELIKMLRSSSNHEDLVKREAPEVDFDQADLYMVNELTIDAEIRFLNAEEAPSIEFERDGVLLINLFPFEMLQGMVEANSPEELSDIALAKRILLYRINDA